MFNFCSLYSGSSGNSLFVESENTKLLIDAGVSCKKIENALFNINIEPSSIDGILITHEHSDHVQGLGTFAKKYNLPVYANKKTFNAMPTQIEKISEKNRNIFTIEKKFEIGDLKIKPFSIPHDASDPCGFNIYKKNKKISIATDIGHMSKSVIKNLEDSIFIMIESNYDPNVLKCSKYPYILKNRIAGPIGHLSNNDAGKTIAHLLKSGLSKAILGHLSKESNLPELAYKTVVEELIYSNYNENSLTLSVASRDTPGNIINI